MGDLARRVGELEKKGPPVSATVMLSYQDKSSHRGVHKGPQRCLS